MGKGIRGVFVAVVILGLIGAKIYMRTPQWRLESEESRTIPAGQAYVLTFTLKKQAKVKVAYSTKDPKRQLMAYWLDEATHKQLQAGTVNPMVMLQKLGSNTISQPTQALKEKEFQLNSGSYAIYFEESADAEESAGAIPFEYKFWIYH